MASRSAEWVFGVALFISSARTIFANTGPFLNVTIPLSASIMFVPVTSAGIRSGVNCILEKLRSITLATVFTSWVFPVPGRPSSSTFPSAIMDIIILCITSFCPIMSFDISSSIRLKSSAKALIFPSSAIICASCHLFTSSINALCPPGQSD